MIPLPGKRVLVFGRDASGAAAAALLRARGAEVTEVATTPAGDTADPAAGPAPDLVVVSAAVTAVPAWITDLARRGTPVIGERELAFEHSFCLHVAVTGECGKSTTADLIAHLLRTAGRRVEVADAFSRPASTWVEASRELDLLVHAIEPAELDWLEFFRPVVGVVLNLPHAAGDTPDAREAEVRRASRLFARQQAFDWAIVEAGVLARMTAAGVRPAGKVVTFSAAQREADLGVERGLLVSRIEGWTGPLWDTARGKLRGPHFAEDALAALAVGRVLRLALEEMTGALGTFVPGPGRFEFVGEGGGVKFHDDGRAASLSALEKALLTLAPSAPAVPFIVLVAGGDVVCGAAYDLGPLLSSRVRQVRLFGAAAPALQAAWNLFTPCSVEDSALNAVGRATLEAVAGETVLYSPACPIRERAAGTTPVSDLLREAVRHRMTPSSSPEPPSPTAQPTSHS